MFNEGDSIVHPSYGAGILNEITTMTVGGTERIYYHIELVNGDTLMIPDSQVEETGLRPVKNEVESIFETLKDDPVELTSAYKAREANVTQKIYSGNPREVAEALRDLTWRAITSKLSAKDIVLKNKALQLLTSELSLHDDVDAETITDRVESLLQRTLKQRLAAAGTD